MIREKLANDIALMAEQMLGQHVKTASWRKPLALAALGLGGTFLAAPAVADMARDAGTIAGYRDGADHLRDARRNLLNLETMYNDRAHDYYKEPMLNSLMSDAQRLGNNLMHSAGFSHRPTFDDLQKDISSAVRAHNDYVQENNAAARKYMGYPALYGALEGIGLGPISRLESSMDTVRDAF